MVNSVDELRAAIITANKVEAKILIEKKELLDENFQLEF